ncbi:MAG TPA: hypothetical protein VE737_08715 [Actinomycetota bacterium]|nr:hypothetical protein [Actinomycetota bacterium]
MAPLALGVALRWAQPGPADFTPLLSMLAGVVIARFVVGIRLGPMSTVTAAGVGAAWAGALPYWGVALPTLLVIVIVAIARLWVDRSGVA